MATSTVNRLSSSRIIDFGPEYFRDGYYSPTGIRNTQNLPFLKTKDVTEPWEWSAPDFYEYPDPFAAAEEFGIRSAAAWVIMVGHQGIDHTGPSLEQIVRSNGFRAAIEDENDKNLQHLAASCFLRHVQCLLWSFAQTVSPAQIVSDAEAEITEAARINLMDLQDMRRNKANL